jgi:uncharacterized protein YgbK (DUF1537 family)
VKELGAGVLEVEGEIEPGLPILKYKDLNLVTKAGGFGDEETLAKAVLRLKGMS